MFNDIIYKCKDNGTLTHDQRLNDWRYPLLKILTVTDKLFFFRELESKNPGNDQTCLPCPGYFTTH